MKGRHLIPARLLVWLVAGLASWCSVSGVCLAAGTQHELVLLNWAEYMPPELLTKFEAQSGIRVKEIYYKTEEGIDQILTATQGKGYDLMIVSRAKTPGYARKGWLAEVDAGQIPNLKHIDPYWIRNNPVVTRYGVPYLWGTVGIAYRKDLVKEEITSWLQLFKPKEEWRGKIMMIEDTRDTVGMALKALGYSLNTTDTRQLAEAEALLLTQKPFVRKYGYMSLAGESDLHAGKYWLAMMYNGDALTLMDRNSDVVFVSPREGTNIWLDCIMVMSASTQKKQAMRFINFLLEPKNGALLAEKLYMATPNLAARKLLPKEQLEDPNIYPDAQILSRSEFYQELPPRILKKYNTIFAEASQGLL